MYTLIRERAKHIAEPKHMGSYPITDCTFLMKDISDMVKEQTTEERERLIQSGGHYSEMLPIEKIPTTKYMDIYYQALNKSRLFIAEYISRVAESILKTKGKNVILVSLARAGTPIGVLIKRYIKEKYRIDVPHYSVSIIRDKGLDENAMVYIINKHNSHNIQFVDGWTGKGAINGVLSQSCNEFEKKYMVKLDPTLAVLSDPAKCVKFYGTREDFLIPSACLNSTVSGLVSRTFVSSNIIGEYDFHGAKYYKEYEIYDVSNDFVNEISKYFKYVNTTAQQIEFDNNTPNTGLQQVIKVKEEFGIADINMIKPGVGETTRVLLRRIPWKILIKDLKDTNLEHILLLAKEKNVPVEIYKNMSYSCMGIIQVLDQ